MRWKRGVGGNQIDDRRGMGGGGMGGGGFPMGRAGGGLGGLGLVIVLLTLFLGGGLPGGGNGGGGIDIGPSLQPFPGAPAAEGRPLESRGQVDDFVAFVVHDVQRTWTRLFQQAGRQYRPTKLVLFEQAVSSGCGNASSATGPFYCPVDSKVYLDLSFFRELRQRFGAPGDFAQAYVIAHEFGHHVQNVLGIADEVRREQQGNRDDANELSIRMELQADCLAGVWAHSAYKEQLLESGDLEEGLAAAAAVGDDRIQEQATGRVERESWTHGSSEQRTSWFRKGFDGGDVAACDSFSGSV
ncbi:MAG: zinc metallopeptidase [Actinobacteria bacterium]|nr:zinc metallopeptidase [Actinomycetota bacterium]